MEGQNSILPKTADISDNLLKAALTLRALIIIFFTISQYYSNLSEEMYIKPREIMCFTALGL
jgi:hypothetical protein